MTAGQSHVAVQQDGPLIPDGAHGMLRLVLDTNAVLDWLLFRDKGFLAISAAIESRLAVALTSGACLEELRRVLRYPEFKLDSDRQAQLLEQYCRHVCVVEVMDLALPSEGPAAMAAIPRCKDPDDQKFLELASQQGAILVTKDKLLLQLAKRVANGGRFLILRPDLLVQRYLKPDSLERASLQ